MKLKKSSLTIQAVLNYNCSRVHMRDFIVVIIYARASRVVFHTSNYRVGCLYIINVQLKTDIWPQI